jgi:SdrD B-like domain
MLKLMDTLCRICISLTIALLFLTPSVLRGQCVTSSGTYNQRIGTSADDAEELESSGAVTLNGTTYDLLYSGGSQVNGLRFTSVNIPVGATITSAYIEFTANAAASTAVSINIYGQDLANPTTFTTGTSNVSSRTKTNNVVAWTPTTWAANTAYPTSDLSTVVQEIVNQGDWASGNAMAFILDNTSNTNVRIAKSYDNLTTDAPRLVVNWEVRATISTTVNVSGCSDSNGNTAGGTSQTTVQVVVDWQNRPGTQDIVLKLQGQSNVTIDPDLVSKPYIYNYTLTADGTSKTVDANWSITTTCSATQKTALLPSGNCLLTPCLLGNTGGTVWRDFNNDGIKDAAETQGLNGVTVKAYDCTGTLVATTTTDYQGQYTFGTLPSVPSSNNKMRIEFSNISAYYNPSFNGTNGRTDIQIIAGTGCAVNYGVNNPLDYCQTNPFLATNCYVNGNNSSGTSGASDVLVKFSYNNTGGTPSPTHVGIASEAGSTWGLAYQRETKKLFSAAFLKRHAGFGPLGTGGIYVTDMNAETTASFVNLNGLGSISTGTDPHSGLLADKTQPSKDSLAFHEVGKRGLGDIDLSDDGKYLYVVNLFTRELHKIFINNPAVVPTATDINTYTIPNPCGTTNNRPFGLKFSQGKLYVGVVCTGESSQSRADMTASVYQFDPTTGTFGASPVVSFPLNYLRGRSWKPAATSNKWYPWLNNWNSVVTDAGNGVITYPQPWLTDIEFDIDGSMILGFRDRGSDQFGVYNQYPNGTNMNAEYVSGGDILRAHPANSSNTWVIEANGVVGTANSGVANSQGLGGSEFYKGDFYLGGELTYGHEELSNGGLALLPGQNEIAMTSLDPPAESYGFAGYNSNGVRFMSNTDGTFTDGYIVYDTDASAGTFQKSGGLGDIEIICNTAPIQVGNYVWYDQDHDGVQDPCEQPLSNITLSLWKAGVQVATTTTNSSGEYYFTGIGTAGETWTATIGTDSILPNTAYEIRIDTTNQSRLDTVKLSLTNSILNAGNDQNDSDASISGNYAVIGLTTGDYGSTNHTFDFGFYPFCDTSLVLTNTTVCNPTTVNLFSLASGTKGILKYSTNGTTWITLTNPTNVTPSVTTTYYVKDSLSPICLDIDTLQITVNQPVTAGAGTNPVAYCQAGSGITNLNLFNQLASETTGGVWSQPSGTVVGSALNTETGILTINGLASGVYVFRYTVTGTAPCPNDTEDVTVTINACCPPNICLPINISRN